MLGATIARGTTIIENGAREPEIVDIAGLLSAMGASIEGAGTPTLVVHGVQSLRPVAHQTVPDRIAAGTWAFAAAITGGTVDVRHANPGHLAVVLNKLTQAGCRIEARADNFTVTGPQ